MSTRFLEEHYRILQRLSKRRQRIKARAEGYCPTCCQGRPRPGLKTCDTCLARGQARNRLVGELLRAYREEQAALR